MVTQLVDISKYFMAYVRHCALILWASIEMSVFARQNCKMQFGGIPIWYLPYCTFLASVHSKLSRPQLCSNLLRSILFLILHWLPPCVFFFWFVLFCFFFILGAQIIKNVERNRNLKQVAAIQASGPSWELPDSALILPLFWKWILAKWKKVKNVF